jgi:hypothetical protein
MFSIPYVLRLHFRNCWRYICCLLVQWFLLVCWFVGCWLWLFGSSLRFGPGVQFSLFMISRWFGACCFLFFDSALQGWGPVPMVGDILFFGLLLFLGRFTVFSAPTPMSQHAVVLFSLST